MYSEIPYFGMRAYALFFSRFGTARAFGQSELDFILSEPMKKKVFFVLLKAGWLEKRGRGSYACRKPADIFAHLLDFRVPDAMKQARRPYAFSGLSAIEIWSDYAYTQRSMERSPYFIRVLKKDVAYWKGFFAGRKVPCFAGRGTAIGEFVVLLPAGSIKAVQKGGLCVEPLEEAMAEAKGNEMHAYAYRYMEERYGRN